MNSTTHPPSDRQLRKRARQEDPNTPSSRPLKQQKTGPRSDSRSNSSSKTKRHQSQTNRKTRPKQSSIIDKPHPNTPGHTNPERTAEETIAEERIAEEHLCPICHQLLYHPVQTQCQHRLCQACMEHWADVSSRGMVIMDLDETIVGESSSASSSSLAGAKTSLGVANACLVDTPTTLSTLTTPTTPATLATLAMLTARCPMCRAQTSAEVDVGYADKLAAAYPSSWAMRAAEGAEWDGDEAGRVQSVTVFVGNRHGMVERRGGWEREWMFFVRMSRVDIIEEVQIQLYPSTRRSAIILQRAPYNIWRTGDACVMVVAYVILKAGYSWISDDAVDSPDGVERGMLPLEWVLDFDGTGGTGSMGRCVFKVKNDRDWSAGGSEEERDQREWDRLVRAYQRDGRYEPPDDDD